MHLMEMTYGKFIRKWTPVSRPNVLYMSELDLLTLCFAKNYICHYAQKLFLFSLLLCFHAMVTEND